MRATIKKTATVKKALPKKQNGGTPEGCRMGKCGPDASKSYGGRKKAKVAARGASNFSKPKFKRTKARF